MTILNNHLINRRGNGLVTRRLYGLFVLGLLAASSLPALGEEPGVTATTIKIGGVMDLKGDSMELGLGANAGITAALKGEKVQNRTIEFRALNDFYTPAETIKATQQLINEGVFLMLGNVGTPTAKAILPILAEHKIPAVGFFTGADLLRPGVGDIVNFRTSYSQEIAYTIEAALAAGVKPKEVCAYVQNDAYGMSGISGLKAVLAKQSGMAEVISKLDQILAMDGENPARNDIGPVGIYSRNSTTNVKDGYESLKKWEQSAGTTCRLVVTAGVYAPTASFIEYSRYKGDPWIVSALSFTGVDHLVKTLKEEKIADKVILTHVVPSLDSTLPIVQEARTALGLQMSYITLEGFIVGKMFLAIMRTIKGDITRENFIKAATGHTFDLGGLKLDFTNDNQGSDFVQFSYLNNGELKSMTSQQVSSLFGNK